VQEWPVWIMGELEYQRMIPVSRCVREMGGAFEPEVVAIISTAYQAVLTELGLSDNEDKITLLVARRIIELASKGERDPDRLRAATLASMSK
jgi:hypothetical protein